MIIIDTNQSLFITIELLNFFSSIFIDYYWPLLIDYRLSKKFTAQIVFRFSDIFPRKMIFFSKISLSNAHCIPILFLQRGCWKRGIVVVRPISKMAYVASHLAKGITHQQRVMRLYRNSLKHLLSWCIDRQLWRREAMKLRDRFDDNKYERDQRRVHSILQAAEAEFEKMKHPFPYTRKCL